MFGGLSDPIGIGLVGSGEEAVAEEVEADAGIFVTLRSKFSEGPLQAYAYLLFVLIYFPCVAALGAILREVGAGYGWLAIGYLTVLAWITSTLFYQIAVGHQIVWIVVPVALLGTMVGAFLLLRGRSSVAMAKR